MTQIKKKRQEIQMDLVSLKSDIETASRRLGKQRGQETKY